jgi:hypothetical protein
LKTGQETITLHFRSHIRGSYREELERLFFFNWQQSRYAPRITESVQEYAKPRIFEHPNGNVSLEFTKRDIGQTLHVFDSKSPKASLVGVLMFARDNAEQITIVHLAVHETCGRIFKEEGINVAGEIIKKALDSFRNLKGIQRVRIYYNGKVIRLK